MAETRDAATHPIMHRTPPGPATTKNYLAPKVNSAEIKTPKRHRELCITFLPSGDVPHSAPLPTPGLTSTNQPN